MNTSSIAVYTDDPGTHNDLILSIREFFSNQCPYCDFTIISNNKTTLKNNNISLLFGFYLKFFQGTVIFFDINDYLLLSEKTMFNSILYLDNSKIDTLDRNSIKNCDILTVDNNNLKLINNHELQRSI